jgi:PAS domain S-box-containing protein
MSDDHCKSILLVEDEVLIALNQKMALEKCGYRVTIVHSGEEAVGLFEKNNTFDLILMDIDLGKGIDGTETADMLSRTIDIPVIFLSNHTEPEVVEKIEKITSYGYVAKNSTINVLDASIKMAFKLFVTKRTLQAEKAHYQKLFDTMAQGVVYQASDGTIISANKAVERILGVTLEQMQGLTSMDLRWRAIREDNSVFPGEEHPAMVALHTGVEVRDTVMGVYHPLEDAYRWILINAIPLFREGESLPYEVYTTFSDFTERRQAQEVLKTNMSRLDFAMRVGKLFWWEMDCTTGAVWFHERKATSLGYEPGMFKHYADFTGLLHPEDVQPAMQAMYDHLEGRKAAYEVQYRIRTKSGEYQWFEDIGLISKRDGKGRPLAVTGMVLDITERKRAAVALMESEARFRSIFDQSPVGSVIVGLDKRFIRCNAAFCNFLGYSEMELIGKLISDVTHPDDEELGMKELKQIAERKLESFTIQKRYVRKDGGIVWGEVSISLVRDAAGRPSYFLPIIQDITVRRNAEEKIRSLLAEKELLLHEVHHRIKNNMSTVMGMLSLQANTMGDPGSAAALNDARRRMQSMMVLYDKLYRSEGVRAMSIKEYLVPLVHEIVGNFPNGGTVTIEEQVDDVILDAKKLSPLGIIVNELLSNAMKHVQDNGIGLPVSFDFKTSAGFGLRLVNMLTDQLRGSIRIERGEGTTFILECEL